MLTAVLLLTACEKLEVPSSKAEAEKSEEMVNKNAVKKFTFAVKGDFETATFTRGYLAADGQEMTDLWVFDYVAGVCVQKVHQTATDEDWGKPTLALSYGSHHVYFVASRGDGATLDEDGHTIIWTGPRDTFWKDYAVDVVSTSNGNRAVTLDRCVTKLRLTVNDEVPATCKSVVVTPGRWFYGLDYVNGVAVAQQQTERTVNVPASYVGTSGQLVVNIFGLSGSDEWVTDVSVQAKDGNGDVIGSATITGAPFKSNRATEYSGNLFGSAGGLDVSVSAAWESAKTGTW
jgi:hypothetical protein